MSDRSLIARLPRWPLIPLGVYALSRLIDTLIILRLKSNASTLPGFNDGIVPVQVEPATYWHIIANWDGQWYRLIAEHGYPHTLPVYANGDAVQNQWAFYPGFPMLCRLFMHLGMSFEVSAALVSTTAGAVGCCLLFALIRTTATRFTATMSVLAFCFFPAAVMLQAAYTESLAFALIAGALLALNRHRYGWFIACAVALSLTRPVALPLAAVIAVHGAIRWWRRDQDPFPVRERWWVAGGLAAATASFAVWPAYAGLVTGVWDAYTKTQLAWPPFQQWVTWIGETLGAGGLGVSLFTIVSLAAVTAIAAQKAGKAWPTELRIWSVAYVFYLFATLRVSSSIFRYLMLAILPWWPMPNMSENPLPRVVKLAIPVAFIAAGTLLQYEWTRTSLIVGPDYRFWP